MDREQIEREIGRMLAQLGVSGKRLLPASRLRHDLGLDGDDAAEFFSALAARFGTDLTDLEKDWKGHFAPEGFPIGPAIIVSALAAVTGAGAMLAGLPAIGGVAVAVVVAGTAIWLIGRRDSTDGRSLVTIGEIVDAVERGRWERPPKGLR